MESRGAEELCTRHGSFKIYKLYNRAESYISSGDEEKEHNNLKLYFPFGRKVKIATAYFPNYIKHTAANQNKFSASL